MTSSNRSIFSVTAPFVRGIHRWPVDSLMICAGTNGWANNQDPSDLRRHHDHYDVTVMFFFYVVSKLFRNAVCLIWSKVSISRGMECFQSLVCQSRVYGILIRICLLAPVFMRPPLITWYTRCFWLANMFGFNTLRLRQNGRHFVADFFKRIFLNENVWIFINVITKFNPKSPIDNI